MSIYRRRTLLSLLIWAGKGALKVVCFIPALLIMAVLFATAKDPWLAKTELEDALEGQKEN